MADTIDILRRVLAEADKDDKDALLEELKGRKLTGSEVLEAIKELDPEARKELRALFAEAKEDIDDENKDDKDDKDNKDDKDDKDDKNDKDDKDKNRRTRPGRKSGRAYGWWLDDDGEIVKLDIARVYSGEDEPDEVEMLPKTREADNDDDEEDVA